MEYMYALKDDTRTVKQHTSYILLLLYFRGDLISRFHTQ